MTHHGAGDRWLAGEAVDGVRFALGDAVRVNDGRYAEERGTVALLLALAPEPLYLVRLQRGEPVRVRQSALDSAG